MKMRYTVTLNDTHTEWFRTVEDAMEYAWELMDDKETVAVVRDLDVVFRGENGKVIFNHLN